MSSSRSNSKRYLRGSLLLIYGRHFWDDCGGDTFCHRCGGCAETNVSFAPESYLQIRCTLNNTPDKNKPSYCWHSWRYDSRRSANRNPVYDLCTFRYTNTLRLKKNRTPACDQYGITAPVHNIHKLFQQRETLFNFRLTTTKKFRHLSASRLVCSKYQADLMRLTLLVSSTLARDEISHYLLSAQTSWSWANILTISDRQLQVTKQCCRTKTDWLTALFFFLVIYSQSLVNVLDC